MASHPFTDDPRLSAYALGELSAVEAAAFAKEIANCPEAHAEIAEIKSCVQSLTKALAAEPVPTYRPIETRVVPVGEKPVSPRRRRRLIYAVTVSSFALLAVAVFYNGFVLHEPHAVRTGGAGRDHFGLVRNDAAKPRALASRATGEELPTLSQYHATDESLSALSRNATANLEAKPAGETQVALTLSEKRRIRENRSRDERVTAFSETSSGVDPKMIASGDNDGLDGAGININGTTNGGTIDLSDANANGFDLRLTQTEPRQEIVNEYLGEETESRGYARRPAGGFAGRPAAGPMAGRGGRMSAGPMAGRGRPLSRGPMGGSGGPMAGRSADSSHDPRFAPRDTAQSFERGDIEGHLNGSITQREEQLSTNPSLESRIAFHEAEAVSRVVVPDGRANPSNEAYAPLIENAFLSPAKLPLSTFGLDVDTASYANVRRFLQNGQLPPKDAVRIEELVNYFGYHDPQPEEHPLNVSVAHASCPWNPQHKLVRIGLKGKEIVKSERPISNLVFLVDVSGSMQDANKLPLVQVALQMLAEELGEKDHISIVTYSNEARLLLPPTSGHQRSEIQSAIARLSAGGSTNGAAGIQLAYDTAKQNLLKDGSNRVILCTDGDFNVGITDDDQLVTFIRDQASAGVFLSIFGFGMGNLKDAKLEKLADRGNGHYGYIDSTHEARKVFVEELTSTLYTIAKDVKLQVEFNPSRVSEYRLIGYENRLMPAQDFNDDTKDSGDLGAGHSVVAMYEIVPVGVTRQPPAVDNLKYQSVPKIESPATNSDDVPANFANEWLTVKVRYQTPTTDENVKPQSVKLEFPLKDEQGVESLSDAQQADFLWSAAVTMYGLLLRESNYRGTANYDAVLEMAMAAKRDDSTGRKAEFVELVNRAKALAR